MHNLTLSPPLLPVTKQEVHHTLREKVSPAKYQNPSDLWCAKDQRHYDPRPAPGMQRLREGGEGGVASIVKSALSFNIGLLLAYITVLFSAQVIYRIRSENSESSFYLINRLFFNSGQIWLTPCAGAWQIFDL